jgi:hypothetical protein
MPMSTKEEQSLNGAIVSLGNEPVKYRNTALVFTKLSELIKQPTIARTHLQ